MLLVRTQQATGVRMGEKGALGADMGADIRTCAPAHFHSAEVQALLLLIQLLSTECTVHSLEYAYFQALEQGSFRDPGDTDADEVVLAARILLQLSHDRGVPEPEQSEHSDGDPDDPRDATWTPSRRRR